MKINKRLTRVASYVDDNSYLIDVGCDHALLCIYLVKNKKNINCIASDLREGPLKQASKNIDEFGLNKNIKIKLGEGLSTLENNVDTIVISGMGGKTIIDIMLNCKDYSNIKKIILSPNNDLYLVRRTVISLGFLIEKEEVVFDRGKYYSIIILAKGKKKYSKKELFYGCNILCNDDLINYYKYLIDTIKKKKSMLPKKHLIKKFKLLKEINILNKILKKAK
ncbi:MAG: class I SAM-dependent methyltransferase [bacterium]|nr:class I SAM-dependent methyltransferase [bacterium]